MTPNQRGVARSLKMLGACVLIVASQYSISFASAANEELTEDQKIVHVLNRLGFGPRPGDIERVREMGIDAYIEEQLHPARIPDAAVNTMLENYDALEMGLPQLLDSYAPLVPQGVRRRATIYEKRRAADARAAGIEYWKTAAAETAAGRAAMLADRPFDYQIINAKVIRGIYSERQLQEVMADFWMNHFNIQFGDHPFAAHFEESVVRPRTMGRFEDLVMAVAKHPSMLNYLDNWKSSAPAEVVEERLTALEATLDHEASLKLRERRGFYEENQDLNENFARELMELHTIGVDAGYTQDDVIAMAKVLTGWTISPGNIVNAREEDGIFVFEPLVHVEGDKTVFGYTVESGGIEEGEQVIRMLANHPAAARFISTKLARRFVADDPPAALVDAAARTFEETGGDIREVLRTIFSSPQFLSTDYYQVKIKKPIELVFSALRAVDAKIDMNNASGWVAGGGQQGGSPVARMGELVYNYSAPDGNADVARAWINTNALMERLKLANGVAAGEVNVGNRGQVRLLESVDLDAAEKLLDQLGLPRPTAEQIAGMQEVLKRVAERERQQMMEEMMAEEQMMMAGGPEAAAAEEEIEPADPQVLIVATMLGSPGFQKR
jgi:uncharacterized protein (DUF1800 family)